MRLLCSSYCAKPFGKTPLTVAPLRAANKSPEFGDGEGLGEPVGLGETVGLGDADGETLGDGLGEPDGLGDPLGLGEAVGEPDGLGEPDGETVGEGVAPVPPLKVPVKIVVAPFLTATVEPALTVGTV